MSESGPHKWSGYFEWTRESEPRPLLVKALENVTARNQALDLGSGALMDTKHLLNIGFQRVVSIDKHEAPHDVVQSLPAERTDYKVMSFEDYEYPKDSFDIVNAQNSLSYATPGTLPRIIEGIKRSLKLGGIFTGHFLGPHDTLAESYENEMTFVTREEVEKFFGDMDILTCGEKEWDQETQSGEQRHWHRIGVIAKKRAVEHKDSLGGT